MLTFKKINTILPWVAPFFMMGALTGCKENVTYTYLMQHPDVLKDQVAVCQSDESAPTQSKQCEMVLSAASNMSAMISDQQQNPEQFGQRVLEAQAQCVQAKLAVQLAEAELATLKQKPDVNPAQLTAAQIKLNAALANYHKQNEQIKIWLAILGLGSPD